MRDLDFRENFVPRVIYIFNYYFFKKIIASLTNSFITNAEVTDFWSESDKIQQARLIAIAKAQQTIDFETFFITPGKRADDFAAALAERASAGVRIRLIVDSYG